MAATAGLNTSPTMAINELAKATGQKTGNRKMTIAPNASTARDRMMMPRLDRVMSIVAPMGVCTQRPSKPPTVVTSPTSDWLQCCWVTRSTFR